MKSTAKSYNSWETIDVILCSSYSTRELQAKTKSRFMVIETFHVDTPNVELNNVNSINNNHIF